MTHKTQFGFFGHVTLEYQAITGRNEGIKPRERQWLLYTKRLANTMKLRPVELIHLTDIKGKYHRPIINVRI